MLRINKINRSTKRQVWSWPWLDGRNNFQISFFCLAPFDSPTEIHKTQTKPFEFLFAAVKNRRLPSGKLTQKWKNPTIWRCLSYWKKVDFQPANLVHCRVNKHPLIFHESFWGFPAKAEPATDSMALTLSQSVGYQGAAGQLHLFVFHRDVFVCISCILHHFLSFKFSVFFWKKMVIGFQNVKVKLSLCIFFGFYWYGWLV